MDCCLLKVLKLPQLLLVSFIVHGMWTDWTEWTDCLVICGAGTITRQRECSNPPPSNGGDACNGEAMEELSCERGICGGVYLSAEE